MAQSFISKEQKHSLKQFFLNLRNFGGGGNDSCYPDDLGESLANVINSFAGGDVEIFADPINGDDNNLGTQAQPVKSFQRAWTLGAIIGRRKRRIYLAAGTYQNVQPSPGQDVTFYTPPPYDEGEPLSIIGTAIDMLGVLKVTAVDLHTTQVSAAPHVGNMKGATVRVLTGAAAGCIIPIKSDDGTTFFFPTSVEWITLTDNMAVNDLFVVERPGSIITTDSRLGFSGGPVSFKNIKIDTTGGIAPPFSGLLVFDPCVVQCMVNCEITAPSLEFNGSTITPVSFGNVYYDPQPYNELLESGSVYIHDVGLFTISVNTVFGQTSYAGAGIILENCPIVVENGASLIWTFGGFAALGGTNINVGGDGNGGECRLIVSGSPFNRVELNNAPGDAVILGGASKAEFLGFDINNSGGYGLILRNGSFASSGDLGGINNLSGGMSIQGMSQCNSDNNGAGGASTTITGPGGDVLVGAVPQLYPGIGTAGYSEATNPADATTLTLNRFGVKQ